MLTNMLKYSVMSVVIIVRQAALGEAAALVAPVRIKGRRIGRGQHRSALGNRLPAAVVNVRLRSHRIASVQTPTIHACGRFYRAFVSACKGIFEIH